MNQKQMVFDSFSIPLAAKEQNVPGQGPYGIGKQLLPLLFLFFICLTPVILIWMKLIPFAYRFQAFFCTLAGLACFCYYRQYRLYDLGFRTDNLKSSLVWNLVFCFIGGIGLLMMHKAGLGRPDHQKYLLHVYLFYVFFLGPVQELLFRGILFTEIKRARISGNLVFLLISTLSFCLLHIIYHHPPLLIIALISGLAWGIIFIKKPNIWGIAFSHSVLGALAMALGLI